MCSLCFFFFFFSSRRRHTRSDRDWSSDVCSSDLQGEVKAQVEQTCVVTLEPVGNAIDEEVDLLFVPGAEPRAEGETDENLPEPLIDGRIDLGAIATEFLVLGIDPYPRKPGVAFEGPKPETNGTHP